MHKNVVALVAGVVLLAPAAAMAQESIVEGSGVPMGEGTVLHPTAGAELGFTDNVFYQDLNRDRKASGILRIILEGALASKDTTEDADVAEAVGEDAEESNAAPAMKFRAGGRLAYHEFLSTNDFVQEQRTLSADFNGQLIVAPEGTFSFSADERFLRDTRPTNFESFGNTNRIANALALGLKYQPGGRTINGALRWENQIDVFEDEDQQFANRMINTFHLRGEWMLFPYTKIYADASYGFISGIGDSNQRGATPIRGGAGIATALTELFTIKANLGWAHAGYDGGASYNQPLLGLEVGYRYSPVGRLVLAYALDARDSINADFYRDHALRAQVDQQISKIVGTAIAEVRLRGYRGVLGSAMDAGNRDDVIFAVGARAQYVVRDWMAVVADWRTEVDTTDYRTPMTGDDPGFTRTEVTAGVRAAF